MQHKWSGLRGVMIFSVWGLGGCATARSPDPAPSVSANREAAAQPKTTYRPGEMAVNLGDEPDSNVGVHLERGFLNQGDVNAVLEANTPRLIACYDRAGLARRYAEGEVTLRFLVRTSGEVSDVLVVNSQLGSFPVERCLVVEGRKIPFPKPGGDRPADFDYNIRFRSTHAHRVVNWGPQRYGRTLADKVPSLTGCGRTGEGAVSAVAFVRPGGRVVSVGFSSDKPIDTMAAKCVVDRMMTWRLPAERTHVVRTTFPISGPGKKADDHNPAAGSARIGSTARLRRASRRH